MIRRAVRWALAASCLLGCDDALSYGRLRAAPDGGAGEQDPRACEPGGPSSAFDGAACGDAHALCSCGDFISSSSTRVDGFDSRTGSYAAGLPLGSLAVGGLLSAGDITVADSLRLAGGQGAALTGDLTVGGTLTGAGPVQGPHTVEVGGDARLVGPVRVQALRVAGSLTMPEGAPLEVVQGAPAAVRAQVTLDPPCSCAPRLDLKAQLDAARASNDNASIALEPTRGLRTYDLPRTLELPCGNYYVDTLYAASAVTLRIRGRVGLFVAGQLAVEPAASLTISLEPDAELDLIVGGGVVMAGTLRLGDPARPLATRWYVEGGDSFFFAGPSTISASVYAPGAELVTQAELELYGAALVRRVAAEAPLRLHQDLSRASCPKP